MFDSLVEKLTGIFSTGFLVGALAPTLLAIVLNGAALELAFGVDITALRLVFDESATGFGVFQILLSVVALAIALKTFSRTLRRILEGSWVTPGSRLYAALRSRQVRYLDSLVGERILANASRAEIEQLVAEWRDRLGAASSAAPGSSTRFFSLAMSTVETAYKNRGPVAASDLERAVVEVVREIARGAAGADQKRMRLYDIIFYSVEEWASNELQAALREEERFGSGSIALTRFGNVGESLRDYSLSRYGFHLDTFWSRLEPMIPGEAPIRSRLEETKATLDFMVSSTCLVAASALFWIVFGLAFKHEVVPSLFLGAAGWILGAWCYRSAIEAYVVFGDVVRSSVDLYRLAVFDALALPRPLGLREERRHWDALGRVIMFGQRGTDFSYRHERDS